MINNFLFVEVDLLLQESLWEMLRDFIMNNNSKISSYCSIMLDESKNSIVVKPLEKIYTHAIPLLIGHRVASGFVLISLIDLKKFLSI